jgi:hypothetical protein
MKKKSVECRYEGTEDRKEGRERKTRGDEKRQGTVSIRC